MEQASEEFSLGLEPTETYQRAVAADIARQRATTENRVAIVLVLALVASLPVYFIAIWLCPSQAEHLKEAVEKWYAVMGPLTGAAVGVGLSNNRRSADSKTGG